MVIKIVIHEERNQNLSKIKKYYKNTFNLMKYDF